MKALINRKNNSNYTRQMVNKALKEASIMANHEIVKFCGDQKLTFFLILKIYGIISNFSEILFGNENDHQRA